MTTTNDFTVSGPGSFALASNWNLDVVPNSTEDAVVNSTDGDAIINATQETVNGIGTGITDAVRIENDAALTLVNGTDTLGNFGSIVVNLESQLAIDGGTVDNASVIELAGFNASGFAAFMSIQGQVTLDGGGQIEMAIGGGAAVNLISAPAGNTSFLNEDNTISGDGTLGEGLKITNGAAGLIETNNSTSDSGGHMQIEGSAGSGSFINDGTMRVDPTGEFIFGVDSVASNINNEGQIILDPDLQSATLAIAGNVSIQTVFGATTGRIEMEGPGYSGNQIVSDGQAALLTLYNQLVYGAGTIGDANLTLTLLSATIDADAAFEPLLLDTGSNTITNNSGVLVAFGGDLVIESPVNNSGGIIEENGDNGIVDLFAAVTGSGTINVDQGTLDVHAAVAGNITFTGGGATIIVESGASLQGVILGAAPTDAIDDSAVNFVSGVHAVWQQNGGTGTLSLVNNGSTLAAFTLSGLYTSADFVAASDGNGGTLIQVINPAPPAGTTADMIMSNASNGDYEIYDVGGNAVLAAYSLGQVGAPWTFVGLGAFQAGDTSDMLLRNTSTGGFEAYYVSDNNITSAALIGTVGTAWNFAGTGDFDGQSSLSELLLRNSASGSFELYQVAGGGVLAGSSVAAVGNNFTVEGVGNFSGFSTTQMMMQDNSGDASNGQLELYTYQPGTASFSGIDVGKVGTNLTVVGMADLLGNGTTQMVMQQTNGDFWLYSYNAGTNTLGGQLVGAIGSNFQVVGFGPLGTSGQDEMLMQDAAGDFEVYQYNASLNAFVGNSMGAVGAPWVVDGIAGTDPPASGASTVSAFTAQLVQTMASMGGGAAVSTASGPTGGVELSQPTLLTTPHA